MLNRDQISSAFWFFTGMIISGFSIPYDIGNIHSPGTGFFPFYTGMTMSILSIGVFIEATVKNKKGLKWENPFENVKWTRPLIVLSSILIYALILDTLGFMLATSLLIGFLLRAVHPQKWSTVILGATLTSLITYMLFKSWLGMNLPVGIVGF